MSLTSSITAKESEKNSGTCDFDAPCYSVDRQGNSRSSTLFPSFCEATQTLSSSLLISENSQSPVLVRQDTLTGRQVSRLS